MQSSECTTIIKQELKDLSTSFDTDDFVNAIRDAQYETGFSYPTTDGFEIFWLKQRTKRHLFFMLLTQSAKQFKFKQFNLQQRYEHYRTLLRDMDRDFNNAVEENPHKFANVSAIQFFGHKVDAGFAYEEGTGRDKSYTDDQLVIVTPSQSD